MGNRLEWILGSSNYCKEVWKQKQRSTNQKSSRNEKNKIKYNKKIKAMGNRLECILGCSKYCQVTWNQNEKTKVNQQKIIKR